MSHLIALALPVITGVAELLKVVLILVETCFGNCPGGTRSLLGGRSLTAHGQHALLAVVIIILHVYLIVDVVHVLLL